MSNIIEIPMNQVMAPDSCILHDKSTGLYLYGDLYVADEFMREKNVNCNKVAHHMTELPHT